MEFLLLALLGGVAASFGVFDGSDNDDTPRDDVDTPGDDSTPGDTGDDVLSASGNETVSGGDGRDLLNLSGNATGFGDAGVDRLEISDTATGFGGEGQDRLNIFDDATGYGGAGPDILEAVDRGTASAFGGEGDDTIEASRGASGFGEAGDDTMLIGRNSLGEGGDGNDTIDGRVESTIHGNAGDDTLRLLAGGPLTPNIATGGDGDDQITLQSTALNSDAELTGGNGADSFILNLTGEPFVGEDLASVNGVRITDFSPAEDVLFLAGAPPSSIDILASGESDTEIQIGFGNGAVQSIILENTNPSDIDPDDILFTVDEDTPFSWPGGDFPFTQGDVFDPILGTDAADTVTTDQDAVIGTGAGNDQVTIGDANTRSDLGADDDLLRVQGGSHIIDAGTGNDTVEGAMVGAVIDLGDGNDVASVTFSDAGDILNGVVIDPGEGDDTIQSLNLSDDQVQISLGEGEGDDSLRIQGNTSVFGVQAGDQLTLTLTDDVTTIDISANDRLAPIDPITIELTDAWTSGDDLSLRVFEVNDVLNKVYVSIGGEEVISLSYVGNLDALQFNVVRV